jgi:hypothetical protein
MRAAVYHGPGDVRVRTVPVPEPGPGEVLVKVAVAGICGTDAAEYSHPRLIQTGVVLGPARLELASALGGRLAIVTPPRTGPRASGTTLATRSGFFSGRLRGDSRPSVQGELQNFQAGR